LDAVKGRYDQIRLGFHKQDVEGQGLSPDYNTFLDELGGLFFSQHPYIYETHSSVMFRPQQSILSDNSFIPQKPNQKELLCKGNPLGIGDYIVLATKIRYFNKNTYKEYSPRIFDAIQKLAVRYKIVILGEKIVEMRHEYTYQSEDIYGIYNDLIANIPNIVDLTVPKLGLTTPSLTRIQQDCLIMNEAKAVITIGIGGNFCMALGSDSNVIGLRMDNEPIANILYSEDKHYPNTMITKNFDRFISQINLLC
jgi:hypothetical protein